MKWKIPKIKFLKDKSWKKLFKASSKNSLGVDIGTSSIKIIELSKTKDGIKLENYGELDTENLYSELEEDFDKNIINIPHQDIARGVKAILDEAKINSEKANFSIPDFSSFFTTISLPVMDKEELDTAVRFEAQRHVPLPASEITVDWQLIKGVPGSKESTSLKVLIVAVSNKIIDQYQKIAELSSLEMESLEAEIFCLSRVAIKGDEPTLLLDIGDQSSTINIINKKTLNSSYSFDTAGDALTKILAKKFKLNYKTAEEMKRKYGLLKLRKDVKEALLPSIDLIIEEIERISDNFSKTENKKIEKIILTGGGSLLPGLKEYLSKKLSIKIETVDPFSNIIYPPIIEKDLKIMGPSYIVAIGAAMNGLN